MIPASTKSLIVAAAAIERLGPDYTFTTYANGVVSPDGVVEGDLTLVGGGDPLLATDMWIEGVSQKYPPINHTSIDMLADQLVREGVRTIRGRIVGDGTRYDDQWFNPSWNADIAGREAGPVDSLMVNDSWLGTTVEQGVARDPALLAAQVFRALLVERGVTVAGDAMAGSASSDLADRFSGIGPYVINRAGDVIDE